MWFGRYLIELHSSMTVLKCIFFIPMYNGDAAKASCQFVSFCTLVNIMQLLWFFFFCEFLCECKSFFYCSILFYWMCTWWTQKLQFYFKHMQNYLWFASDLRFVSFKFISTSKWTSFSLFIRIFYQPCADFTLRVGRPNSSSSYDLEKEGIHKLKKIKLHMFPF